MTFVARASVSAFLYRDFFGILMFFFFIVQSCTATFVKPRLILCFKAGRVTDECYFSWCMFLQDFTRDSGEDFKLQIFWILWKSLIPIFSYQIMFELTEIVVFFVMCNFNPNFLCHCNNIIQNRNMSQVIGSQEGVCNVLRNDQFVGYNLVQQRRSSSWYPCRLLFFGWMQLVWCENWVHVHFAPWERNSWYWNPHDCDVFIFRYASVDCDIQRFQEAVRAFP